MKQLPSRIGALGALFVISSTAWAQPPQLPEPLYSQDYERGMGTWTAMGEGAKISTERLPENTKGGNASLRFDYQVAQGQNNILLCPFATHSLSTLQSISFWIKANRNASLAFVLQEQGGGRFGTFFSVVKDKWQHVEIAPSDLVLQVGKDDPFDANGKLDVEQIEGAALLDFDQFFAQVAGGAQNTTARLLGIEMGPRTFYLDNIVFSSKPLFPDLADNPAIDDFKRPQAAWLSVGGATVKTIETVPGKPESAALQVDYTQTAGRLTAISKLLAQGTLAQKKSLLLTMASKRRATLIVQLEEKSGGKYNAILQLPGDAALAPDAVPTVQTLPFTDFRPSDDSKDDNDRLDLDQVKQILIIDASGMLRVGAGDNTLWVHRVSVK